MVEEILPSYKTLDGQARFARHEFWSHASRHSGKSGELYLESIRWAPHVTIQHGWSTSWHCWITVDILPKYCKTFDSPLYYKQVAPIDYKLKKKRFFYYKECSFFIFSSFPMHYFLLLFTLMGDLKGFPSINTPVFSAHPHETWSKNFKSFFFAVDKNLWIM